MPTLRILEALPDDIAPAWDALHDGNPFVSHAFLSGLEQHGCLRADWGWRPHHLGLWDGDALVAAAPAYRKQNSHGEFVFDHAWANAYARYGHEYYPKLLCASPYSPVTGPRLLTRDPALQRSLLTAMTQACEGRPLSSAHVNFHTAQDDPAFDDARFEGGWLARSGGGDTVRLFVGVGILGGFTTFSSFSMEYWMLFERGQNAQAAAYVFASVIGAIAACGLGLFIVRQVPA